jgi:hypothetical protein
MLLEDGEPVLESEFAKDVGLTIAEFLEQR